MINEKEAKKGVKKFGYVNNLKTYLREANALLAEGETEFAINEIDTLVDTIMSKKQIDFRNKYGKTTSLENALYAIFSTDRQSIDGKNIIVYYQRQRVDKKWEGIYFTTLKKFDKEVRDNLMFQLGDIKFENWQDGLQFLEDLKTKCIPEKWSYKTHQSGIPHPILKSYIENTFEKLKVEDNAAKILKSDDGKYAIFNTGLLDRFFHEIFIIIHVINDEGELLYRNAYILNSLTDLTKIGFTVNGKRIVKQEYLPEPATFFTNINEVIFQPDIEIDRNYEKFTHIIDERRERFPKEDQDRDTTELARKLDNSINDAVAIAKRNYKLVIPMYRPQTAKIQLLMPIYLSGSFTKIPDFALVLDLEDGIYTPETILPLDAAYQNARLITKPDELWLNPDDI